MVVALAESDFFAMPLIKLHKLNVAETVRVNSDEIRTIEPLLTGHSVVRFNNDDTITVRESETQIARAEWSARYLWPNVERLIMALLGGIAGALVNSLLHSR